MEAHKRTDDLSASPQLFESDFLNFFSRVHPAIPAVVFVPVVVAMEWLGLDGGKAVWQLALLSLGGIGIWTLTEYWLHRLVFHWEPDNDFGRRMHFIIHGIHHDHPNDKLRLVMPPAVAIPLAALFFGAFVLIFGTPTAYPLFGGFIFGYLRLRLHALLRAPLRAQVEIRQTAARGAHAPPLPGPPLRLRGLLAALGRGLQDDAAAAAPLTQLSGTQGKLQLEAGVGVVELLAEQLAQAGDPVAGGLRVDVQLLRHRH